MREMEDQDRMSTAKKVVAGAALGIAVPAAVAVGRRLLGSGGGGGDQQQSGSHASQQRSRPRTVSGNARSPFARGSGRTKEQLYDQAKRLNIEGRSSMTKAQLERAISRARG